METIVENCKKMLIARKYTSIEDFVEDEETFIYAVDCSKRKVMVKFLENSRLNISTVKQCIADFANREVKHGIILFNGDPTASAKKTLANLDTSSQIKITMFPMKKFHYCLTDHRLVRPHFKIKKDECQRIKKHYGDKQLPTLLSSDPVARYYNFKPGDVIGITRKNGVLAYRIVK